MLYEVITGEIINDNYKVFKIKGKQQFSSTNYLIEGDWSGAAGLLIAGAIGGEIIVDKLQANSTQADKAVLEALEKAGAIVTQSSDCYTVKKPNTPLKAFVITSYSIHYTKLYDY